MTMTKCVNLFWFFVQISFINFIRNNLSNLKVYQNINNRRFSVTQARCDIIYFNILNIIANRMVYLKLDRTEI